MDWVDLVYPISILLWIAIIYIIAQFIVVALAIIGILLKDD